jgi:membrane dipeptidase
MGPKRVRFLLLVAAVAMLVRCGSGGVSPAAMDLIRRSQARWLTLDGRLDAAAGPRTLARMDKGGLDAAFFVVPHVPVGGAPASDERARTAALEAIRSIKGMAEDGRRIAGLALAPEDAYRLEKEGRHAVYIGLADGGAIGTDPSHIAEFYGEGVRYLTLCGKADNAICASAHDRTGRRDGGLSDFGRRVVAECNRIGMIIDLADCSEKSFFDVLALSRAPVIVSSAAARAFCDVPGNLSDEMIKAIAAKGGVLMVTFEPGRLVGRDRSSRATVADIVDHIDHAARIAGIDGIGIGSDFGDGGGVSGCRDAGDILNLTVELLRRGYDEHEVEAVWGGNFMRAFKRAKAAAGDR